MPSIASLQTQQYYAHPRNAFWPIMGALTGVDAKSDYAARTCALQQAGIGLWDVLGACEREGSLDSAILPQSEQINDIAGLLKTHIGIRAIALNGGKARQCFMAHIMPSLPSNNQPDLIPLPSTSPAHAAMRPAQKQHVWHDALSPYLD